MEWWIALAIIAGNTVTVLLVQLFGNRKQKADTELSIVQAQHVVLRDLNKALEKAQQQLKAKERQLAGLREAIAPNPSLFNEE